MKKYLFVIGFLCPVSAWAALPTILVNSATGSDTAASGAGPGTALTGSAASTNVGGTVVTLDGSPDLSGVATDGSHVIFLNDTTAGNRNFGKITAVDDGADTVTVANAFGGSLSGKSWAIGGKRASLFSTTSKKLFVNNSTSGDAMPGWVIEMESGHSETFSSSVDFYRAGNDTDGPITLKGTDNAATRPVLTYSGAAQAFIPRAQYWYFKNFELLASATATKAVDTTANPQTFELIKFSSSGAGSFTGFDNADFVGQIINCEISFMKGPGINSSNAGFTIRGSWIHDNTGNGITVNAGDCLGGDITGNIIETNGGDGIRWDCSPANNRSWNISNNTIYGNTGDGIENNSAPADGFSNLRIYSNIFANNGGYGVNFSNASSTLNALKARGMIPRNNNTYSNTSGAYNPSGIGVDDPGLDPQFTNAASSNFTIGTNLKAQGFPEGSIGFNSTTSNYLDIGAAQRQESSSTSGGSFTFVQ